MTYFIKMSLMLFNAYDKQFYRTLSFFIPSQRLQQPEEEEEEGIYWQELASQLVQDFRNFGLPKQAAATGKMKVRERERERESGFLLLWAKEAPIANGRMKGGFILAFNNVWPLIGIPTHFPWTVEY